MLVNIHIIKHLNTDKSSPFASNRNSRGIRQVEILFSENAKAQVDILGELFLLYPYPQSEKLVTCALHYQKIYGGSLSPLVPSLPSTILSPRVLAGERPALP